MAKIYNSIQVPMSAVCAGALQKSHTDSKFAMMHIGSEWARTAFGRMSPKMSNIDIVVLQVMAFDEGQLMVEYIELLEEK